MASVPPLSVRHRLVQCRSLLGGPRRLGESLWMACGRKGIVADFLKGLIKLAAAGVKALEGKPEGVKSHSGRAAELWRGVGADHEFFMGFRIRELIGVAEEVFQKGWPTEPPLLRPTL